MVSLGRAARRLPWMQMVAVVGMIAIVGAAGVLNAAGRRVDNVERLDGMEDVLTPRPEDGDSEDQEQAEEGEAILDGEVTYFASNYLIVGSDSRENLDELAGDVNIGSSASVGGQRSDVIMILRQETNGAASMLSIPRDLWTDIPGYQANRINAAYNYGPAVLIETITEELGVPINHYIEVDFEGFADIVDAVGGVELCFEYPSRDVRSGLDVPAGCQTLDGPTALSYARSRHYQQQINGRWVTDGTGDIGRIQRQQQFVREAVKATLAQVSESPFSGNRMIEAATDAVRIDNRTDPIRAARALRSATAEGLTTYMLPTYNDRVGDAAILRQAEGSSAVLAYFAGEGPPPLDYATGDLNGEITPDSTDDSPTSTTVEGDT